MQAKPRVNHRTINFPEWRYFFFVMATKSNDKGDEEVCPNVFQSFQ